MPEMKSLTLNDKTYDCFVDSVARDMATRSALTESASGESVAMSDASNYGLTSLRVFGKTTQNGTPTPDAPVELVNIGKGSITVNVNGENEAQSMTIATPNGLPGIPVTEGGNYTDANGQQWVCDEIDFARGVYVQRVYKYILDGSSDETWFHSYTDANPIFQVGGPYAKAELPGLCSHYEHKSIYGSGEDIGFNTTLSSYIRIRPVNYSTITLDEWKAQLSSDPMTVDYVLTTPIETPLSEEELAAYASLHTYKDNTTVSNDAGAWMELEYVMDAKKYIDGLMTGTIIPATVE